MATQLLLVRMRVSLRVVVFIGQILRPLMLARLYGFIFKNHHFLAQRSVFVIARLSTFLCCFSSFAPLRSEVRVALGPPSFC